jgi:hypothetical protein
MHAGRKLGSPRRCMPAGWILGDLGALGRLMGAGHWHQRKRSDGIANGQFQDVQYHGFICFLDG